MTGKKNWIIPDGFLQPKSLGDQVSHEAVCVLNLTEEAADIKLTFYFEDREPMDQFVSSCGARRTHHIRLDKITDKTGEEVPRGVPYAIKVDSSVPVVVQHSRLDTSQEALALFTTIPYSLEV
ncbi:sensory rhodopsin transducer [Sediminibacillus massiliensis]|uniref:sensory rhodopsin transducer n=1 Tax=Sediminibacillus massiliensis TaxID=1926277 RepID=UPI0009888BC4|nr:sensory rhodopsin transducer [Sediminibacillus massiliensis]